MVIIVHDIKPVALVGVIISIFFIIMGLTCSSYILSMEGAKPGYNCLIGSYTELPLPTIYVALGVIVLILSVWYTKKH